MVRLAVSGLPLVSVCIANYNGAGMISGCIESVLRQDFDFPVEILVHDDASTDSSAEVVARDYPDVRLIRSDRNVGFCIGNNRMVAMAKGRFVLLLNNDATLMPDALTAFLAEAARLPCAAILTLPQYDADTGALLDQGGRLDPFLNPVPNRDPATCDVGTVHGACLWIDKLLWDELGGFPEWFGSVGEDLYLCCCARLAGYQVRSLAVSGYRHRVGQSFGGGKTHAGKLVTTFRRRALSERNKTCVMVMTYPGPFLQVMLPLHLVLLLFEGVLLSVLKGRWVYLSEIYLPVFSALYRNRKRLHAKRTAIMRQRRLASADFFVVFDRLPYKLRMLLRHGLPRVS